MAKGQQTIKSFRALVGVNGNGAGAPRGVYVLDSNDTSKHYAFLAIIEGLTPAAENFSIDYIRRTVDPYVDTYKRADLSRPGAFLKNVIGGLTKELVTRGHIATGDVSYSLALILVKNEHMYIGRLNSFPVYFLKDRKFRQVLAPPKKKGPDSLQVVGTSVNDGEMLVLGTTSTLKNLTELELKSILMSDADLSLVCSKVTLQANKYGETDDPRVVAIRFSRNRDVSQAFFSRRNFAIIGMMALVILLVFLSGEIMRSLRDAPIFDFITSNRKSMVRQVIEKVSMPRASSYNMELVYDRLTVPYDLTIAESGFIYVVDQKEKQGIIRIDPETGQADVLRGSVNLSFPTGIDLMNDSLYVVDFSYSVNLVYIFDTYGTKTGEIPDAASKPRISLYSPKAVEGVDSDNTVYICDRGNNRLLKFDHEGTFQKEIKMPSGFKEPNGIAITEGGVIFITLKMSGQIGTIETDTVKEFTIFEDMGNRDEKKIMLAKPSGIAVDRKGTVYVADTGNQRIVIADRRGKLLAVIDGEKQEEFKTYYPLSVKLGPDGDYIYVVAANRYSYDVTCSNQCNGKIWKIKI